MIKVNAIKSISKPIPVSPRETRNTQHRYQSSSKTNPSVTSLSDSFVTYAEISSDLLKKFTLNHKRHKCVFPRSMSDIAIFDFANEKYIANPRGLLKFRTPISEEKSFARIVPSGRTEGVVPGARKFPTG